jgi:hypothetical protein
MIPDRRGEGAIFAQMVCRFWLDEATGAGGVRGANPDGEHVRSQNVGFPNFLCGELPMTSEELYALYNRSLVKV